MIIFLVLCILIYMHIYFWLCRMIERTMSPIYDIVCQTYCYIPCKSDTDQIGTSYLSLISFDVPKEFFQMLTACGPYLHRDTQLLQKVTSFFLLLLPIPVYFCLYLVDVFVQCSDVMYYWCVPL
jgi:hypothetical protein